MAVAEEVTTKPNDFENSTSKILPPFLSRVIENKIPGSNESTAVTTTTSQDDSIITDSGKIELNSESKSLVDDISKFDLDDNDSNPEDNEANALSESSEKEMTTSTTEISNVLKSEAAKKDLKKKSKPLKKKDKTLTTEVEDSLVDEESVDEKASDVDTAPVKSLSTISETEGEFENFETTTVPVHKAETTDWQESTSEQPTFLLDLNQGHNSGMSRGIELSSMDKTDVENISELWKDTDSETTTMTPSTNDLPNEIGGNDMANVYNSEFSEEPVVTVTEAITEIYATEHPPSTSDPNLGTPLTTSDGKTNEPPTTSKIIVTTGVSEHFPSEEKIVPMERQPKNLDFGLTDEPATAKVTQDDGVAPSTEIEEEQNTVASTVIPGTEQGNHLTTSDVAVKFLADLPGATAQGERVSESTFTTTEGKETSTSPTETVDIDVKSTATMITEAIMPETTTTVPTDDSNNLSNSLVDPKTAIPSLKDSKEDGATVTQNPNVLFTYPSLSITTLSVGKEEQNLPKEVAAEVPESSRRQKQMNLDKPCPCFDHSVAFDSKECLGERTTSLLHCPCSEVCARQSGESCSQKEPCDHDFGLQCHPETSTCQGLLGIEKTIVTHKSISVRWGREKSEIPPQATVFFASTYRGPYTHWTEIQTVDTTVTIENLQPNANYFIRVEQDGKQEIAVIRTKDGCVYNATLSYGVGETFNLTCNETCTCYVGGEPECHERCFYPPGVLTDPDCTAVPDEDDPCCMTYKCKGNQVGDIPKILVTQRTPSSLTAVWDDFRLPSHHSEYILEYRTDGNADQVWHQAQPGSTPMTTLTHLKPATPYQLRVTVWEDGEKKSVVSEVVTETTEDGCVRENLTHYVGDEFFRGCDFRCTCLGGDQEQCIERCNAPYVTVGTKADDPLCYEKPLPTDPCCVMVRCSESRALEDEDNDHDICMNVHCGPNALCVSSTMSCRCADGFEGNPNDLAQGCTPSNASSMSSEKGDPLGNRDAKNLVPNDLAETSTAPTSTVFGLKNDLESNNDENKLYLTTEDPFGGKVTSKAQSSDEENVDHSPKVKSHEKEEISNTVPHFSTEKSTLSEHSIDMKETSYFENNPWNSSSSEENDEADEDIFAMTNSTELNSDAPVGFDGCEYNNKTYDRGVRFEDGCVARCICDGTGHISCSPRCAVMASGGPGCQEVPDPDDSCCKIMLCNFPGQPEVHKIEDLSLKVLSAQPQNGTTVRIRLTLPVTELPVMVGRETLEVWFVEREKLSSDISQWNKRSIMLSELTEVQQGVFEFDITGLNPNTDYYFKVAKESRGGSSLHVSEFSNTVNAKTFPAAVKAVFQGCFHHNKSYSLGENFYQGCEYKCVCRENGFIECQDRCELYIDTVGYEGCEWVPSEEDSCCFVPSCSRRRIPALPDGTVPLMGGPEGLCVVGDDEVYRVGDMWELEDGCRTKICRCSMLSNGSTTVQCQSECPALAPNAHIPNPQCPNPVLIKPDGPCSCPYVSCTGGPRNMVQPPRPPQCEFKGKRYDMGQEFHDGCISLCHCGQDLRVSCAAIECPYHFSAEFTNCLEWDIDPNFFPSPPHCCAPSKCKNDGSCIFSGQKFNNFEDIPSEMLPCGTRCICVNGNVTCENRCPPVEDIPPRDMRCPPSLAYKGHPPGETCCMQWMCKEPVKQGNELQDVSIVAINSTAVRIRFTLSNILVGLIGHAEVHFTTDPTLPPNSWHLQKFSRPKRLFDSPNIEYILNALRPNTTYFLQLKIQIDALQGGPESELFKLRMPEEVIVTSTTTVPPVVNIDANPEAHIIDANTVRVSWSNFSPEEKKLIYALQLKYKIKNEPDDKWITTPMIHRDVTSYFLHDLKPSATYLLEVVLKPPKDSPTKLMSSKTLEIHTTAKAPDMYDMKIQMETKSTGTENSELVVSGVPEPISKYVHVAKISYKLPGGEQQYVFKVPQSNRFQLEHLTPGKKYLAQMELYLTNGQTLYSNEVEFITKPAASPDIEENLINDSHTNGKLAEPLQSNDLREDENRAYFIALVVVAVVAAVAGFGFVLLLVLLVRRQASAKAPISRTPSESAYDNPTYKTYDGERLEDKTNGQAIQTTQA